MLQKIKKIDLNKMSVNQYDLYQKLKELILENLTNSRNGIIYNGVGLEVFCQMPNAGQNVFYNHLKNILQNSNNFQSTNFVFKGLNLTNTSYIINSLGQKTYDYNENSFNQSLNQTSIIYDINTIKINNQARKIIELMPAFKDLYHTLILLEQFYTYVKTMHNDNNFDSTTYMESLAQLLVNQRRLENGTFVSFIDLYRKQVLAVPNTETRTTIVSYLSKTPVNITAISTDDNKFQVLKNHLLLTNKIFDITHTNNNEIRRGYRYKTFEIYYESMLLLFRTARLYITSCINSSIVNNYYTYLNSNISHISNTDPNDQSSVSDNLKRFFYESTTSTALNQINKYGDIFTGSSFIKVKNTLPRYNDILQNLTTLYSYIFETDNLIQYMMDYYKNSSGVTLSVTQKFHSNRDNIKDVYSNIQKNINLAKKKDNVKDDLDLMNKKQTYILYATIAICLIICLIAFTNSNDLIALSSCLGAIIGLYILWSLVQYYYVNISIENFADITIYNKDNILEALIKGKQYIYKINNNIFYRDIIINDLKSEKQKYDGYDMQITKNLYTIDLINNQTLHSGFSTKHLSEFIIRLILITIFFYYLLYLDPTFKYYIVVLWIIGVVIVFTLFIFEINNDVRTQYKKKLWISR